MKSSLAAAACSAGVLSLILSLACGPPLIRWLGRRATERIASDSLRLNELHAGKQNTPTMGGLLIAGATLISILCFSDRSSLLVWMCVCGPIPELQVGPPMKMLVVFLLSIIPTLPAAFLTTAEEVLYQGYNQPIRLWGLSVQNDQQLAGIIMKVISGFYLWFIIAGIFFKWSLNERGEKKKYRGKLVPTAPVLDDGEDADQPQPV